MQVTCTKVAELMDHTYNVALDDFPTFLEEKPGESVMSGHLVDRHQRDRSMDLGLSKWGVQTSKITLRELYPLPLKSSALDMGRERMVAKLFSMTLDLSS